MPQGTISKLYPDKGYGFVEGDRNQWFFHQSVLEGVSIEALRIGQSVEYEEGCGPAGLRANSIRPL
ncbi:MAG: cold-shock protein [Planctomycetota bacterium]|jgi:cold shock CspA family protein